MKNLQIKISKKGTRVVTATNLYEALALPGTNFARDFRKWLEDVYEFKDGIRSPKVLKDYSKKVVGDGHVLEDYYLSVELAKLITLQSRSKFKRKYARLLKIHEGVYPRTTRRRKTHSAIPGASRQAKLDDSDTEQLNGQVALSLW